MSKLGHNVLFVDPPINTGFLLARHFFRGQWSLKRLITQRYRDDKVNVFSPLNPIPLFDWLGAQHAKKINRIAKRTLDKNLKTILWVYNVEIAGLEHYLKTVNYDLLVYDCVDNYSGFPKYNTPEKKKKINEQEKFLSTKADVVFATAPGLVKKLKKYNPNVNYTPNVGDFDRFFGVKKTVKRMPSDMKNIPGPIIGFTGAVDNYKFDKDLLKKVALDYPKYSFVVIGPAALKDRSATRKELGFEGFDNIHFLGRKDYTKLARYKAFFDVAIIPYQLNDYTVGGCFPVKFHNYLAVGLPVVVTDLPAFTQFSDVCYISKSYNEFSHNIRKALEENSPQKVRERQRVARQNTWDKKVETMLKIVSKKLK
jgi:hypothetical protein